MPALTPIKQACEVLTNRIRRDHLPNAQALDKFLQVLRVHGRQASIGDKMLMDLFRSLPEPLFLHFLRENNRLPVGKRWWIYSSKKGVRATLCCKHNQYASPQDCNLFIQRVCSHLTGTDKVSTDTIDLSESRSLDGNDLGQFSRFCDYAGTKGDSVIGWFSQGTADFIERAVEHDRFWAMLTYRVRDDPRCDCTMYNVCQKFTREVEDELLIAGIPTARLYSAAYPSDKELFILPHLMEAIGCLDLCKLVLEYL